MKYSALSETKLCWSWWHTDGANNIYNLTHVTVWIRLEGKWRVTSRNQWVGYGRNRQVYRPQWKYQGCLIKATRNSAPSFILQKKKKRKKTQHDPGVQPGLQIFKLEEILSQRTNIYRAGIQVGFLHFNTSVSKREGLYLYSIFCTLTKLSVDLLTNTKCVVKTCRGGEVGGGVIRY